MQVVRCGNVEGITFTIGQGVVRIDRRYTILDGIPCLAFHASLRHR